MAEVIKRIIVLGGGTAGWLSAAILAKKHAGRFPHSGIQITLIESAEIAVIGVGEGTWPTMRSTLAKIGISESQLIQQCSATFKQASKFVNWIKASNDVYYHPFTEPQGFSKVDPAAYWQGSAADGNFAQAVCFQHYLCEAGLAPKTIAHKEYEAAANYGYHLDAAKFITLLRNHCIEQLGVEYICDTVEHVMQHDNGDIRALHTKQHGELEAQLFIDCSGMNSLLMAKTLQVPLVTYENILHADTALTTQVAYATEDAPIACYTVATAQDAGWIWDIGLQHRRGLGYVYSSQYCSDQQAQDTLARYIGAESADQARKIRFTPGHRAVLWKNNCVAIGLASGFLEPLEAAGIMLIETSANFVADQLPADSALIPLVAKRFNSLMLKKWQGVIDFIKLHYTLSERTEPYWQGHREPGSIPESLQEQLALWRYRSPSEYDFIDQAEPFSAASYQYILYGAGFRTDFEPMRHLYQQQELAKKQRALTLQRIEQLRLNLPKHRELINKVKTLGFAKL